MPNVTIYHNPHCSKSRQTLELLRAQNVQPTIIEYLKTPPSFDELKLVLNLLNLSARELIRSKETVYREKNLSNPDITENELIQVMIEQPILIERPIVIHNNKAILGRPPEKVLEIL